MSYVYVSGERTPIHGIEKVKKGSISHRALLSHPTVPTEKGERQSKAKVYSFCSKQDEATHRHTHTRAQTQSRCTVHTDRIRKHRVAPVNAASSPSWDERRGGLMAELREFVRRSLRCARAGCTCDHTGGSHAYVRTPAVVRRDGRHGVAVARRRVLPVRTDLGHFAAEDRLLPPDLSVRHRFRGYPVHTLY